jgi:hypothetical protein
VPPRLDDVAAAGFNRKNLVAPLRRLLEAGFCPEPQVRGAYLTPIASTCRRAAVMSPRREKAVRFRRHCAAGQHKGPITRAFLEVLQPLLWGFQPEALKALELAGVLSWQHHPHPRALHRPVRAH